MQTITNHHPHYFNLQRILKIQNNPVMAVELLVDMLESHQDIFVRNESLRLLGKTVLQVNHPSALKNIERLIGGSPCCHIIASHLGLKSIYQKVKRLEWICGNAGLLLVDKQGDETEPPGCIRWFTAIKKTDPLNEILSSRFHCNILADGEDVSEIILRQSQLVNGCLEQYFQQNLLFFCSDTEKIDLFIRRYPGGFCQHRQDGDYAAIDGSSVGAAMVLAICSALFESKIDGFFATGTIDRDGNIKKVDHLGQKIFALKREYPGFEKIFIPFEQKDEIPAVFHGDKRIIAVGNITELIEAAFDLEQVAREFKVKDITEIQKIYHEACLCQQVQDYKNLERLCLLLLDNTESLYTQTKKLRCYALWSLGGICNHQGKTAEAGQYFSQAGDILNDLSQSGHLNPADEGEFLANLGVNYLDMFQPDKARQILSNYLNKIEPFMESGLLGSNITIKVNGTIGQIEIYFDNPGTGIEIFKRSLGQALRDPSSSEIPRIMCYLGEGERRNRDYQSAEKTLKAALEKNRENILGNSKRIIDASYIHLALARVFLDMKKPLNAQKEIEKIGKQIIDNPNPYPGCQIKMVLLRAALALTNLEDACKISDELQRTTIENPKTEPIIRFLASRSNVEISLYHLHRDKSNQKIREKLNQSILQMFSHHMPAQKYYTKELTEISNLINTGQDIDEVMNKLHQLLERIPY